MVAKDETKWEYVEFSSESRGKLQAQNVLTESSGLTRYANRMLDSPLRAFELFVDYAMLTHVQQCTEAEAHRVKKSNEWKLPLSELKAFIFLLYVRGALCGRTDRSLSFVIKIGEYLFLQKPWVEIAFIFHIYLRTIHEKAMYRYVLDGESALAWKLSFSGHLSST